MRWSLHWRRTTVDKSFTDLTYKICDYFSELLAPDGQFLKENDILRRPLYADTLQKIADDGVDYFYQSDFSREMVEELKEHYGSIITEEDLRRYEAIERSVTVASCKDLDVYGVSPPSSGAVLGLILNILESKYLCMVFGYMFHLLLSDGAILVCT